MPEELKEKIISFLKSNTGEIPALRIAEGVGTSLSTAHKWLLVLEAEGKVVIKDYGNLKLVSLNDTDR